MNAALLLLAGWLSATLAPLDPKYPTPDSEQAQMPPPGKPPAITTPAKAVLKPGSYSLDSLKRPEVLAMEAYEAWPQGAAWPAVDRPVIVVTHHDKDPQRFVAFLVDVQGQRIAAIRDGDIGRHLPLIGHTQTVDGPEKHAQGHASPATPALAGSGAVIILLPPRPVGPRGQPDDFTARILDVATMAAAMGQWPGEAQVRGPWK